MCVIVYKPINQNQPTKETLKKCFDTNPHGAGYMLPHNDKVIIRKGFMTFNDFYTDYLDFITRNKIDIVKTPIVYHFRITTQGGVQKELCHPYPITDNYEDMRRLAYESDIALAHNGVIQLTSSWGRDLKYNDTMTFIKDYANLIIDKDIYFGSKKNKCTLLEKLIGSSKLAIMNKLGYVKLIGDFKKSHGIYYSNLNHEPSKVMSSHAYAYKGYDDLIDDDQNWFYNYQVRRAQKLSKKGAF